MTPRQNQSPAARPRHQRGTAMLELVIALPVLLGLMFATAELGRAFFQYTTLAKAARDGARYAAGQALYGSTGTVRITGALRTATTNLVAYGDPDGGQALLPGFGPGDVTLSDAGNSEIRVVASYTYQPMIAAVIPDLLAGGGGVLGVRFTTSVVMRAL